jgi:hypothetical protein
MNSLNDGKKKVVLFKSKERYSAFLKELQQHDVTVIELDFDSQEWLLFDYTQVDIIIYYPSFMYSSNYPLALQEVYDNLIFIQENHPNTIVYPDPNIIKYYNDKYRQYLFLNKNGFSIPQTIPLFDTSSIELAANKLGFPMVVKNRYGAGGGSVFKVNNVKELTDLYRISKLDFFNWGSVKYFSKILSKRMFYYHLIKEKKLIYPFLSTPLLAQKFIQIDRDLKTVVGKGEVVEAHWRIQANKDMWKMNIDDGGIGEWSYVPREAIELSEKLAIETKASWINIDIIVSGSNYYISEFSPVWHHYKYKEKPSFVYKDDYNINTPLETSLNLEKIIVESLINK